MAVWLANANETAKILSPVHNLSSAGAKKPDKRFPAVDRLRTIEGWPMRSRREGLEDRCVPVERGCQTRSETTVNRSKKKKGKELSLIASYVDAVCGLPCGQMLWRPCKDEGVRGRGSIIAVLWRIQTVDVLSASPSPVCRHNGRH
ncbi:hypothetical protein V1477_015150 [Vespula maculifrons]